MHEAPIPNMQWTRNKITSSGELNTITLEVHGVKWPFKSFSNFPDNVHHFYYLFFLIYGGSSQRNTELQSNNVYY